MKCKRKEEGFCVVTYHCIFCAGFAFFSPKLPYTQRKRVEWWSIPQSVSRLLLLDVSPLFLRFLLFFPLLFCVNFWLRLLHQNYTRCTYTKSWGTQEPSGEVSHNVAVPVVDLHVSEVSGLFIWFLGFFLLISGGLERTRKGPEA